jgi:hypothetical protein
MMKKLTSALRTPGAAATRAPQSLQVMQGMLLVFLSLVLLVSITAGTLRGLPYDEQPVYMSIQLTVCILFLVDFFVEWSMSSRRGHFFRTHLLFLLISIPYLNIVKATDMQLPHTALVVLRFIPLVRGVYVLLMIVGWFTSRRATTLFFSYLLLVVSMVFFASLVFYEMERSVNTQVTSFPIALWWAWMDVTTVGSNISAVTPIGRILAVILAAMGMMLFPIFTVYITSLMERKHRQ